MRQTLGGSWRRIGRWDKIEPTGGGASPHTRQQVYGARRLLQNHFAGNDDACQVPKCVAQPKKRRRLVRISSCSIRRFQGPDRVADMRSVFRYIGRCAVLAWESRRHRDKFWFSISGTAVLWAVAYMIGASSSLPFELAEKPYAAEFLLGFLSLASAFFVIYVYSFLANILTLWAAPSGGVRKWITEKRAWPSVISANVTLLLMSVGFFVVWLFFLLPLSRDASFQGMRLNEPCLSG